MLATTRLFRSLEMGTRSRTETPSRNLGWAMVHASHRDTIRHISKEGCSGKKPGVMGDHRWIVRISTWPSAAGYPRMESRLLPRECDWTFHPEFQLVEHNGNYLWHSNGSNTWPGFVAEPTPN